MAVFTDLPAEVLLQIANYLPHSSLVYLCSCSKHLHTLLTPRLYATIIPGTLTGTLRLFRRLVKEPDAGYMGIYKDTVHAVILPKIAATHEVKAAIALALAQCIQSGYLPHLKELRWPFTFVRRGFLEEENAAQFDEPLYLALEETYSEL